MFIDYWSEKYDHLGNHDNEDSDYEGVDYRDDSDEELYDDIENYDTKTALENLELGWGLNSTLFVGLGFPKNKMQSNSHHKQWENYDASNPLVKSLKWIEPHILKHPSKDSMLLDDAVHPFNAHIIFKKNTKTSHLRKVISK